jgi:hypothetical protein
MASALRCDGLGARFQKMWGQRDPLGLKDVLDHRNLGCKSLSPVVTIFKFHPKVLSQRPERLIWSFHRNSSKSFSDVWFIEQKHVKPEENLELFITKF